MAATHAQQTPSAPAAPAPEAAPPVRTVTSLKGLNLHAMLAEGTG